MIIKTNISQLRNSRTAVKRAKAEYKESITNHTYSIERDAVKHQIVKSEGVRMNCKFYNKN